MKTERGSKTEQARATGAQSTMHADPTFRQTRRENADLMVGLKAASKQALRAIDDFVRETATAPVEATRRSRSPPPLQMQHSSGAFFPPISPTQPAAPAAAGQARRGRRPEGKAGTPRAEKTSRKGLRFKDGAAEDGLASIKVDLGGFSAAAATPARGDGDGDGGELGLGRYSRRTSVVAASTTSTTLVPKKKRYYTGIGLEPPPVVKELDGDSPSAQAVRKLRANKQREREQKEALVLSEAEADRMVAEVLRESAASCPPDERHMLTPACAALRSATAEPSLPAGPPPAFFWRQRAMKEADLRWTPLGQDDSDDEERLTAAVATLPLLASPERRLHRTPAPSSKLSKKALLGMVSKVNQHAREEDGAKQEVGKGSAKMIEVVDNVIAGVAFGRADGKRLQQAVHDELEYAMERVTLKGLTVARRQHWVNTNRGGYEASELHARTSYEEELPEGMAGTCAEYLKENAMLLKRDMDLVGRRVEHTDNGILNLANTISTARQARALAAHMVNSYHITDLILAKNAIDDKMMEDLATAIKAHGGLKALDISNNRITTLNAVDRFMHKSATSRLDRPVPIRSFVASGNRLSLHGPLQLIDNIGANSHLTELDLSDCGLGDAAAMALGRMLENNMLLRTMKVGWNKFTVKAVKSISTGLANNQSLTHVNLAHCGLGDLGGAHIMEALAENDVLEYLDVSKNMLGAGTCEVLASSIQSNRSLKVKAVHMQDNALGLHGGLKLIKTLTEVSDTHALPEIHIERCTFFESLNAEDDGKHAVFDVNNPNGDYSLDLEDPAQYQVATRLLRLREEQGPGCMQNVRLNGEPLYISEAMQWPARMPQEGELELEFVSLVRVGSDVKPLPEAILRAFWGCLDHSMVVDEWRVNLLRVLVTTAHFSSQQARTILDSFGWQGLMKQEAAYLLFGRLVDPENLHRALGGMSTVEREGFMERLGMLGSFHPRNPTGFYSLNLQRQLDASIMYRLLTIFSDQHRVFKDRRCFRNVRLNGEPVDLSVPPGLPGAWTPPHTGLLEFDFVSYQRPPLILLPISNAICRKLIKMMISNHLDVRASSQTILAEYKHYKQYFAAHSHNRVPKRKPGSKALEQLTSQVAELGEPTTEDDPWTPERTKDGAASVAVAAGGSGGSGDGATGADSTRESAGGVASPEGVAATPADGNAASTSIPSSPSKGATTSGPAPCSPDKRNISRNASKVSRSVSQATSQPVDSAWGRSGPSFVRNKKAVNLNDPESAENLAKFAVDLVKDHTKLAMANKYDIIPPNPSTVKQQTRNRLDLLKALSIDVFLRHDQLSAMLEALKVVPCAAKCREETTVLFFTRVVKQKYKFHYVLKKLTQPELLVVARRLGWLNIIAWHTPDLRYTLDLSRPDEFEAARLLAKLAVKTSNKQVWRRLLVNGKEMNIAENHQFWSIVAGVSGDPNATATPEERTLEFTYESAEEVLMEQAAIVIQSHWRSFKLRQDFLLMRMSAVLISRRWRQRYKDRNPQWRAKARGRGRRIRVDGGV